AGGREVDGEGLRQRAHGSTPLPASPTRGEVSDRVRDTVLPSPPNGTLPLVGRVGEGVAAGTMASAAAPLIRRFAPPSPLRGEGKKVSHIMPPRAPPAAAASG